MGDTFPHINGHSYYGNVELLHCTTATLWVCTVLQLVSAGFGETARSVGEVGTAFLVMGF